MRIGIDARFLTHPQEGGFKTYTENLVHGVSALDRRNEYVLFTDRQAPETAAFVGNIDVKPVGGPSILREQLSLPAAIYSGAIDVAHFPCNTAPLVKTSPMVLTLHDLIPLMGERFGGAKKGPKQKVMSAYWKSVIPSAARQAKHIITISESSKADIIKLIGIPENRIAVIPTGLHPDFRPVKDGATIEHVREKYQLPEEFILGFASSDPRKNVGTLLRAADILKQRVLGIALVLVSCSGKAWQSVKTLAMDHDIVPHIVECPSRKDLVAIYSMADALAFPSLYEGFGLPVVEAMACGTPVVTSNVSSLPEVAGDAALLVDPADAEGIAGALYKVVTDRYWREEMTERGFARAAWFSWQRTVEQTIAVYERVFAESVAKFRPQMNRGVTG